MMLSFSSLQMHQKLFSLAKYNILPYLSALFMLQAWNTQTSTDLSLNGPVGQVYALVVGNDMLFAGVQVIFFQACSY